MSSATDQPLSGIRIVDMTHDWAGPHATRVMADYGAEVIKVEYPPRLCGMRGAYLDKIEDHPRWWEINRNKASITLDLHRPDHLQALKRLVAASDVVVDNSRPGVMDGFGLSFDVLRTLKSDIIVIAMSAYGASGPESSYAGYGGAIEAISGVQSLTAYGPDGDAMRLRELDVTNGVMGACAIMTALTHRAHTGEGQFVDLAQREATTWLIGPELLDYSVNGTQATPRGNRHPVYAPQGCYRCRGEDRWIAVTIRDDREWGELCKAAERPEWARDPRFATAEARRRYHDELDAEIASWTASADARELMARLQAAGIAAGAVADTSDLASDPHLLARNWFAQLAGARYPGFPFTFADGAGGVIHRRGPELGADNARILGGELGWSSDRLPSLEPDALGTAFDLE